MSEQTFKSPNFYEREFDRSAPRKKEPVGVPAAAIGTANKGPAFVPVTVSDFNEFNSVFGGLSPKHNATYGVNEFLKHKSSFTFLRVLGAGANSSDEDIASTLLSGRVKNAGFKLEGSLVGAGDTRHVGCVQFLAARHEVASNESFGMPMFTDNDSFSDSNFVNLVRGMVMLASGSRMMVLDGDQSSVDAFTAGGPDDIATVSSGKFKLVISSALGNTFSNVDGNSGVKIFTASLDPSSADYFGKVLNTNPDNFVKEQHLLYADFAVDAELASATLVATLSGSTETSLTSGEPATEMRKAFGAFDTRFKAPRSTMFLSQPFGSTEYDLFAFESLDDGEYANKLYKISITNLKASLDESNQFGTFTVQIRDWNDTDTNPSVLESFTNCSLDPNADNYIAKLIGDRKVTYNFDAEEDAEKRIVTFGKYPNNSRYVRVVMSQAVERKNVPQVVLPFGFRGLEILKTNDLLTDDSPSDSRLAGLLGPSIGSSLSGSILPPVPFRYKVTRGEIPTTAAWEGQPGPTESTNSQLYWGIKFERNTLPLNANLSSEKNRLLESYTKFLGIKQLDTLVTGSGADELCNNKFSLSKVVLSNTSVNDLTGTVSQHMKEAAYIRNADLDLSTYTVPSIIGNRITLAHILAKAGAASFNRFSQFTKFTNMMFGGFDGLNSLDAEARSMNDKSTSFDASGGADVNYVSPGFLTNQNGSGQSNSNVYSYVTAVNIMTDPMVTNLNILSVPGIRESFITDYTMKKVKEYGLAYYIMDIPSFDDKLERLYDDSPRKPDPIKTAIALDGRSIDNNYAGTYFPNVFIDDEQNNRRVKVPSSIAALGALAFNDRVAYPWFAPAGFNRASLEFVKNVEVRLNVSDRDTLYESRINPIATFPKLGFVIYGQKTLQIAKSALDRVNVRRLLLEVKRTIIETAKKLPFEQNTPETRNTFVAEANQKLALIKQQSGVERFKVIMNETNNTAEDVDLNRVNGKIIIVPTRTFEFIAIDFIITNSGIEFV
jgi:hypothetical protein